MLIDLESAKFSLRVAHDDEDLKIHRLIEQATAIVIKHIKRPDHGWTDETVPRNIEAAIYHVLHRLYDDPMGEKGGPLPDFVKDMLTGERDPAIA